jgi:hypothetical protein
MPDDLPTPRSTLRSRYARVLVLCKACRHQREAGRLGVDRSCGYRLLEQASGGAVQSSRQWIFARNLIGVLAVIASAGCNQPVDGLRNENNSSMTREDVYQRQLDLDVAAIIRGMARTHGAQVLASTPEP